MNLNDITTKPYILALFKRDDGTRFLLGSGAYEFKEDQMHFVANVMANDVVEVQGSDGALLAGQVRRAATQSFNGFIADASSTKGSVENYRKAFIAFFQKNHYYTVVYIFADGTAIQRKRGFIVDSPEVKELWQMTPEYHVALNFEDVNYYKYAENADGEEIYSNLANLTSKITASGGLIWDSIGSATTTAEGTNFTIFGTSAEDNLESVQIKGQTTQASYSGKNLQVGSQDFSGTWQNSGSWTTSAETYNGLVVKYKSASWNGLYTYYTATAGTTYTFSAYIKADTNRAVRIYVTGGTATVSGTQNKEVNITTEWQRYSFTFEVIGSGTIRPRIENQQDFDSPTYICGYQLEEGVTMTDYEPYTGGIASPNPDYPQTVQTVTGTQTITISDGDSQSQTLSVRLGSVELCKLGTYQDYIYKSNGDWFVHKEFEKINLGSLTWNTESSGVNYRLVCQTQYTNLQKPASNNDLPVAICSHYGIATAGDTYSGVQGLSMSQSNRFYIYDNNYHSSSSATAYNTWVQTNNPIAYWQLATPTDMQITDADLISDLNDLLGADTYEGNTSFASSATVGLPAWLVVEAKTGSGGVIWDNIGATWEVGGEAGDTILTVDSITNVFPTITITGPAHNPQITNVTTGQILKYTGNITSSQKLVIDVQQKTAKLNGTSVISNVSGDWLYLMPGNNRMVYTIDNAEPNTAIIEWQEITG